MKPRRNTQAEHAALLSSDAPVLNRCAKEEAHLQQRLAQSTAAYARSTHQNQVAALREQSALEAQLQSQFAAILSNTSGVFVPTLITATGSDAPADQLSGKQATPTDSSNPAHRRMRTDAASLKNRSTTDGARVSPPSSTSSSTTCALGFPVEYHMSGFKSVIQWASVAYDETFVTAYGPRRLREEAQANLLTANLTGRNGNADTMSTLHLREAQPHRLLAAVACYLLNEVLCADSTIATLWQEKLRQPIFDAIFSSQTIAQGQERRGLGYHLSTGTRATAERGNAEAKRADAIVQHTLGIALDASGGGASRTTTTANSAFHESGFPPRKNTYITRNDFASLRLWAEEVSAEQQEKVAVCRRAVDLHQRMEKRQLAVLLYERRADEAAVRTTFWLWRMHTRQCKMRRAVLERYLENRSSRVLEETVFLRWRRVTLRAKVEALERQTMNLLRAKEDAAIQHAKDVKALEEQLRTERLLHAQAVSHRDALHTQVLESHGMEVETLQLVLQQQRHKIAEASKWTRRWERVAKTFRPANRYPAVPQAVWHSVKALYCSEEALIATVLECRNDKHQLKQLPYSMIVPVREQLEQLLLAWVNAVMEESPLASTWIPVIAFFHGHTAHPKSILMGSSQKSHGSPTSPPLPTRQSYSGANAFSSSAAPGADGAASSSSEFGVYELMCLVRELCRTYVEMGRMKRPAPDDGSPTRKLGFRGAGRSSAAQCFHELVQVLTAQTCGGLYPSLLTHCVSLERWFKSEVIFAASARPDQGLGRERRQQQTLFAWLVAALFVGHIRLVLLAPLGEKDDGHPPAGARSVNLPCPHEAEMALWPQASISSVTTRISSATLRKKDAVNVNEATSATAARVASVTSTNATPSRPTAVANSTFLLERERAIIRAASGRGSSMRLKRNPSSRSIGGGGAEKDGAPNTEGVTAKAPRYTTTLAAALRARKQETGLSLTDTEDTMSDVEAYLGIAAVQGHVSLAKARDRKHANETDGASSLGGATASGDSEQATEPETWVDELLQQLVEARDAATQRRRLRRLRTGDGGEAAGTRASSADDAVTSGPPARASTAQGLSESAALTLPHVKMELSDADEDEEEDDLEVKDGVAGSGVYGSSSARARATRLTAGQLRVLRSLPSRSYAFDAAEPAPSLSNFIKGSSLGSAVTLTSMDYTSRASGNFYAFFSSTLKDVSVRQQWCGAVRVLTSLVVRFRVLDDVEDRSRRANVTAAATGEDSTATPNLGQRPSSPSQSALRQLPSSPPPVPEAAPLFSPSSAAASPLLPTPTSTNVSQALRLPDVTARSAHTVTAPAKPCSDASADRVRRKPPMKSVSSRVPASVVPAKSKPPLSPMLSPSPRTNLDLDAFGSCTGATRLNVTTVGEDMMAGESNKTNAPLSESLTQHAKLFSGASSSTARTEPSSVKANEERKSTHQAQKQRLQASRAEPTPAATGQSATSNLEMTEAGGAPTLHSDKAGMSSCTSKEQQQPQPVIASPLTSASLTVHREKPQHDLQGIAPLRGAASSQPHTRTSSTITVSPRGDTPNVSAGHLTAEANDNDDDDRTVSEHDKEAIRSRSTSLRCVTDPVEMHEPLDDEKAAALHVFHPQQSAILAASPARSVSFSHEADRKVSGDVDSSSVEPGSLDPLVVRANPPPPLSGQNVRKDRFHMQPWDKP